mmetsp:Transcript_13465/g.29517  ORF Transcript_13465/g.29517 Transcript_13465/m.29517 type:complete len:329 (+) Transcript_13465:93-1079(+)
MPDLQIPDDEVRPTGGQARGAERLGWVRDAPQKVLVDEKTGPINADDDSRVVTEGGSGRRSRADDPSLTFSQHLQVLGAGGVVLLGCSFLNRLGYLFRNRCRNLDSSGNLSPRGSCLPENFCPPSASSTRIPENEALVRAVALVARPQPFAQEGAKDAAVRVLDDEEARSHLRDLSVQGAEGHAVHCHAVAEVPAGPNLKKHRQIAHDSSHEINSSLGHDQGRASMNSSIRPSRALDHKLRHLPCRHLSELAGYANLIWVLAIRLLARHRWLVIVIEVDELYFDLNPLSRRSGGGGSLTFLELPGLILLYLGLHPPSIAKTSASMKCR